MVNNIMREQRFINSIKHFLDIKEKEVKEVNEIDNMPVDELLTLLKQEKEKKQAPKRHKRGKSDIFGFEKSRESKLIVKGKTEHNRRLGSIRYVLKSSDEDRQQSRDKLPTSPPSYKVDKIIKKAEDIILAKNKLENKEIDQKILQDQNYINNDNHSNNQIVHK